MSVRAIKVNILSKSGIKMDCNVCANNNKSLVSLRVNDEIWITTSCQKWIQPRENL